VAPPGGFEDAVKRGRRVRRHKATGGTGAALALAGVLAWSTLGSPGGTNGLQPTSNVPHTGRGEPTASAPASPAPTQSPTEAPASSNASPLTPHGTGAPSQVAQPPVSGPTATTRPTRDSSNPTVAYARRNAITENDQFAGTSTDCPPTLNDPWCAYPRVDVYEGATGTTYTLHYVLCRGVDSGPGVVTFDRKAKVEFSATDTSNNDTVWTYSAGQPRGAAGSDTTVDPGNCVEWTTVWDGYDDFGYTPAQGTYRLDARSTGHSDGTLDAATTEFQHS
jgi:hypothetical protein